MTSFFNTPLDGALDMPADARAILMIVHGLAEHRARYAGAIEFFNLQGIAVASFDQRGHGKSAAAMRQKRGDVESFDDLINDAASIVDGLKSAYPQLPLFLWGHSMGAVIATLVAAERPAQLRGVITSSPPIAVFDKVPSLLGWFWKWVSRITPTRRIALPVKPKLLSRDLNVGQTYAADPLVPKEITMRLLMQLSDASAACLRAAKKLRMPWLASHGGDDRVAPPIGSQRLIDALAGTDKQIVLWPEARHEVHNEIEPTRTEFLQKIANWITERAGDR